MKNNKIILIFLLAFVVIGLFAVPANVTFKDIDAAIKWMPTLVISHHGLRGRRSRVSPLPGPLHDQRTAASPTGHRDFIRTPAPNRSGGHDEYPFAPVDPPVVIKLAR